MITIDDKLKGIEHDLLDRLQDNSTLHEIELILGVLERVARIRETNKFTESK